MNFKNLIESCQSIALANKLYPSEEADWYYFCREYSKTFYTPLHEVLKMPPEFVITQIFAESYKNLDIEEELDEIQDIVFSLKDPQYNIEKERAYREELRKLVEEENLRLENNEPVHPSVKEDNVIKNKIEKELPKSGGLNMELINKLQNNKNEM